jgi:hypothetical protein
MNPPDLNIELPVGLVVFSLDGRAQFGCRKPETGELYAESDGRVIRDAVGAVEWHASRAH